MLFIHYPKCGTCKKAKTWLIDNNVDFEERDISLDNPSYSELSEWFKLSKLPIKKLFNTSGQLYKNLKIKDTIGSMTEEEAIHLLSSNGMFVKRPIVVDGQTVMFGFKPDEWADKLLK